MYFYSFDKKHEFVSYKDYKEAIHDRFLRNFFYAGINPSTVETDNSEDDLYHIFILMHSFVAKAKLEHSYAKHKFSLESYRENLQMMDELLPPSLIRKEIELIDATLYQIN